MYTQLLALWFALVIIDNAAMMRNTIKKKKLGGIRILSASDNSFQDVMVINQ